MRGTLTDTVTITMPLPPMELSKNTRVGWRTRSRTYRQWRGDAKHEILHALGRSRPTWEGPVFVIIRWYYQGPRPDTGNIIARCDPILDGAQDAGLLVDDGQVAGYAVERVEDRKPRLVLTFRRGEDVHAD